MRCEDKSYTSGGGSFGNSTTKVQRRSESCGSGHFDCPYPEIGVVWIGKDTEEGTRDVKQEKRCYTEHVYWFALASCCGLAPVITSFDILSGVYCQIMKIFLPYLSNMEVLYVPWREKVQ